MILIASLLFFVANVGYSAAEPEAKLEQNLHYTVDIPFLEKGNFQYFYSLLRIAEENNKFENLFQDQSVTPVEEILKIFLPLDTKKLWDPKDGNYLAVAKVTHILPISLSKIDETEFTSTKHFEKTLSRYEVTKHKDTFHVGGSFITPDFSFTVTFLTPDHPYADAIPLIDKSKLRHGKIKASFMHQDKFGKVLFIRTAKASNALIIYEDAGPDRTLITQYILSNLINVPPARDFIRKGMIENLRDVVKGSRIETQ